MKPCGYVHGYRKAGQDVTVAVAEHLAPIESRGVRWQIGFEARVRSWPGPQVQATLAAATNGKTAIGRDLEIVESVEYSDAKLQNVRRNSTAEAHPRWVAWVQRLVMRESTEQFPRYSSVATIG